MLPIAIPPYAVAYCYADITDKGGSIDNILSAMNLGEVYLSMPTVRSLMGSAFILSLTLFPYIFLILKYSFQNNALKIIESAKYSQCQLLTLSRVGVEGEGCYTLFTTFPFIFFLNI